MSQGVKIVLTEKQENWLKKHFKHTKNDEIAAKLGVSKTTVIRLARRFGLTKSRQFIQKMQAEAIAAAKQSHLLNGTYPPKGYVIPGREKGLFKAGETCLQRIGAKRNAERIKKATATWRETYKKEKARAAFGFPQRTKLRVVPKPIAKIKLRSYLKLRGYIVDDVARVVYYTEETKRGKRIEAKPQPWYKFRPAEAVNATAER